MIPHPIPASPSMSHAILTPKEIRRRFRLRQYKRFLDPVEFAFPCIMTGCTEQFKLTSALCDHIRKHFGEDEDPKCPQCQWSCGGKGGMSSFVHHIRTHTGGKPYKCPIPLCDFASATKGNLKAHLLAARHRDVMSVELLNVILSMDTVHHRKETELHSPRGPARRFRSPPSMEEAQAMSPSMSMMTVYKPHRERRRMIRFSPLVSSDRKSKPKTLDLDTRRFYPMVKQEQPSFVINGIHAQHEHRQATLNKLRNGTFTAVPVVFMRKPMSPPMSPREAMNGLNTRSPMSPPMSPPVSPKGTNFR